MAAKKSSKKSDKKLKTDDSNQIELLKSVIEDLINKQAVPIIDLLSVKKPVNEFIIAEKLGLTINQTRNILYKLSDFGLVSFTRKKDKRKGWYIYFWTLNTQQSLIILEEKLKKKLDDLKQKLKSRSQSRHYVCKTCSIEVDEETALLNNFTCPECTGVYELSDNEILMKDIEKDISKLKKEIEFVSGEVRKRREMNEKNKEKKRVREERKRKEIRREMRMRLKKLSEPLKKLKRPKKFKKFKKFKKIKPKSTFKKKKSKSKKRK